jgi:hypothetical protein
MGTIVVTIFQMKQLKAENSVTGPRSPSLEATGLSLGHFQMLLITQTGHQF